ncbi:MAG: hypothetical protein WD076_10905, partial [Parvularculaceae bacterium]
NSRQQSAAARDAISPLKKTAAAREARLDDLNAILRRLDAALAEPGLYESDLARASKLQKERAALVSAIEAAEKAWLDALEAYESAKAAL